MNDWTRVEIQRQNMTNNWGSLIELHLHDVYKWISNIYIYTQKRKKGTQKLIMKSRKKKMVLIWFSRIVSLPVHSKVSLNIFPKSSSYKELSLSRLFLSGAFPTADRLRGVRKQQNSKTDLFFFSFIHFFFFWQNLTTPLRGVSL
jgi:hypothetical protein